MSLWTPDPTFYPSPRDAAGAPAEKLAYVVAFDRSATRPDALAVLDTDTASPHYGQVVGWSDLPNTGDELHHFGWNACSTALCPSAPHPHVERRYLIVPGLRSSRIHVFDTKDRLSPELVKVIEADELAKRAGYSRPHTVHCGPGGIYLSALGGADGNDGPGGIAILDHTSLEVLVRKGSPRCCAGRSRWPARPTSGCANRCRPRSRTGSSRPPWAPPRPGPA
ncbi:selenium-binding protein SBP56-related protein [Nonomuraea sp. NPDC048901]|uniref:selenium-binding protein SBP56-related protein n=1 Tax=Nonomuraea sp. NPDC048901 TaxID=3155627 RepID=UPI0033C2D3C9